MGQGTRFLANAALSAALVSTSATAKSAAPAPRAQAASDLTPVPLKLTLTESGPADEWELTVQNVSSSPIRFFDDPRVLTLEVAKSGGKKPTLCKLPDELFPKDATDAATKTLPPGKAVHHKLDPRFYCFSPGAQQVLLPSAQITPHYGFPTKTKKRWKAGKQIEEKLPATEPFIAEPVASDASDASDASNAWGPAKNVTGDVLVLDSRYAAWSNKPPADTTDDTANDTNDEPDVPTLEMVKGSDAQSEPNVTATVRLRNPMSHRLVLFLRRELLTFEVLTPAGTISCIAEPDARNPDRRAFSTVARGGSVTLVSRLVELCPRGTFATPGLYLVHAQLDAPADGADYGLDAFTGTLHTERPIPVRVRRALQIIHNRPTPVSGSPGAAPQPGAPVMGAMPPPPMPAAPRLGHLRHLRQLHRLRSNESLPSDGRPTVHHEGLTGDERPRAGPEQDRRSGYFVWLTDPAERIGRHGALINFRILPECARKVRPDEPGCDAVHPTFFGPHSTARLRAICMSAALLIA